MGGIPLDKWSGSGATKELEKTVISLSEASEKQTRHIIKLTYAMLFLTLVMIFMVGAQIYFAMKQLENNPIAASPQSPSQVQSAPSHLPKGNNSLPSLLSKQPEKD